MTSAHGSHDGQKQHLLSRPRASKATSIADAVVIKDEDLFLVCPEDGAFGSDAPHGFGLYAHDCRFLDRYNLEVCGQQLVPVAFASGEGGTARLEMTNAVALHAGQITIKPEDVRISWSRVLDCEAMTLQDTLEFTNASTDHLHLPVRVTLGSRFDDVFEVRGVVDRPARDEVAASWQGAELRMSRRGDDGTTRAVRAQLEPPPAETDQATAEVIVDLPSRSTARLMLSITLSETPPSSTAASQSVRAVDGSKSTVAGHRAEQEDWLDRATRVESNDQLLDRVLERCLRDLRVLRSSLDGQQFFAAGVPWFVTLFGRDSIIAALQSLAFQPAIAISTLRILARYQGDQVDDWRDEQPGRILHELRVGELARAGEIPHTPFYGSIDSSPLFLILLARYTDWSGSLDIFHELRPTVERVLHWIDQYADLNSDGLYEYDSPPGPELINQGWKDSGNAMVDAHGHTAVPPIAPVEMQGYVFEAKRSIAALYERAGDEPTADRLRGEAEVLRTRVEEAFWLPDLQTYAMALQGDGTPLAVGSSNPGHLLWSGLASPSHARSVAAQLMTPAMFSGWGIRTLSLDAQAYNPLAYHLGSVWPHDNSIIAAGMRRYGLDHEAAAVARGILDAASLFPESRLPELFAGFTRDDYPRPVHYPVACHPQAWAAGSPLYLMQTMLGIAPSMLEGVLHIRRPILPDGVERLTLQGLRVGSERIDVHFSTAKPYAHVEVEHGSDQLRIVIDSDQPSGEPSP